MANKRLVLCFDGTWKSVDDGKTASNVIRLMREVARDPGDGMEQIVFYDKGVGTGGRLDRFTGGAFGHGLGENVKDGYIFLGNNWEPGDEVYLFGFSRGAFTARSLAGLLGASGLLDRRSLGDLPTAWRHYRTPPDQRDPQAMADLGARRLPIKCIGVWDTVGSLGIPLPGLAGFRRRRYGFHDAGLGDDIEVALHAVAIDERRRPFRATMWTHQHPHQTVEQVWLPGVHSDVGGAYKERGLGDLGLAWMIERVETLTPLAFAPAWRERLEGDALGVMHQSMRWYYRILGQHVRRLGGEAVGERLHAAAGRRWGKRAPLLPAGRSQPVPQEYAPGNLAPIIASMPDEMDGAHPLPGADVAA